jgi:hypothetical protein
VSNRRFILTENLRLWLSVLLGPLVTSLGFFFIYQQLAIAAEQAKTSAEQAKTAAKNYLHAVDSSNRATAQAKEQQTWKKAEFLANEVKDFYADKRIERVTHIVDWSTCKIRFDEPAERVLCVHDYAGNNKAKADDSLRVNFVDKKLVVIISQALRTHRKDDGFTEPGDSLTELGKDHGFTELESTVRDEFDWFFFRLGQFQHMIASKLFSYEEVEIHLDYVLDLFSGGLGDRVSAELTNKIIDYTEEYSFAAAKSLIDARIQKRRKTSTPAPAFASPAAAAPP